MAECDMIEINHKNLWPRQGKLSEDRENPQIPPQESGWDALPLGIPSPEVGIDCKARSV
ncbi:MAG: hypothetical protein Fur0032_17900 [Terrimicrobiaceae bacterium]